jgi:hypothetical protein
MRGIRSSGCCNPDPSDGRLCVLTADHSEDRIHHSLIRLIISILISCVVSGMHLSLIHADGDVCTLSSLSITAHWLLLRKSPAH